MRRILLVEDEKTERELLLNFLRSSGYEVEGVSSGEEALIKAKEGFDILLLDLKLPGIDGVETLRRIKELDPGKEVIILTAYGTVETAVQSMKLGAFHYLLKPIDLDALILLIERAFEKIDLEKEVKFLKEEISKWEGHPEIVAVSEKMKKVMSLVARVASSDTTVLITGETGAGKEVVARAIHAASKRKKARFVAISCAAIPETLFESELFGYEKGAFTGASSSKPGKFEIADGGTLFLDEVGEIPLPIQTKLLRAIEEKEIERLGGLKKIRVDVRIVAATNKNLEEEVKKGNMREDFYYRLNVIRIHIPPLRERKEDVLPLAELFLRKFSKKIGKKIEGFSKEAKKLLLSYSWPGNVRELENVVERAVVLTRTNLILPEDLSIFDAREKMSLKLEDLEKKHIRKVMQMTGWKIKDAAELLGIHRNTLREKLRKYGLSKEKG